MTDPKFKEAHKQIVVPLRYHVQGTDNQAIIRWPARSRSKKDLLAIQRALFTNDALPLDWVLFKCKVLHRCGTIEEAQLKVNSMINSAINSYANQQFNSVQPNLFLVPNENSLNSTIASQTNMNSSGLPNPVEVVAMSVSQPQLQPGVISVSPHFPSSGIDAQGVPQLQEVLVVDSNEPQSISQFSIGNQSPEISMATENVEDSAMSTNDNFDSSGYIPHEVSNNEDIIFENHSYAAPVPEDSNQIDADGSPHDMFIIQILKKEILGIKNDLINWLTVELKRDISDLLTRLIRLETVVGELEKKLDHYSTRDLDLAEQVQNLTKIVNKTQNVPISLLTFDELCTAFNCQFPLDNFEEFVDFDEGLKKSNDLKATLSEFLKNRISKKLTPAASMGAILRKFMTKSVIEKYTATKQSGKKAIFCDTQLYKLIEGPMMTVWKDKDGNLLPEAQVKKSVGGAINNSSYWAGSGTNRANKRKKQSLETENSDAESLNNSQ
ncbi:hypothetical protein QAD02_000783 [Eretmocerus hayati]|uniref:Uncharacterized protein n=1 Tax=Eretmocerus hayati TaxID=131215 RepID=A0ACC2NEM2_9HYME|nr:hypothetical protein QAD02_000783 [Eretmocerus hayati]